MSNRVGGGIAPAVLPHHRTYGSVSGGSYELAAENLEELAGIRLSHVTVGKIANETAGELETKMGNNPAFRAAFQKAKGHTEFWRLERANRMALVCSLLYADPWNTYWKMPGARLSLTHIALRFWEFCEK